MANETWQLISQVMIAFGILLTAAGGFGAYYFGQRIEAEKERRSAVVGRMAPPKRELILSAEGNRWPELEIGDSGSIFVWQGPEGKPLFQGAGDSGLTVERVDNHTVVSVTLRDRSGNVVAELVRNEWRLNPNKMWDRNYTSDALEVRDPTGDIILQVRARSDRVQLQLKMYDASGTGFALVKVVDTRGAHGVMEFTGAAHPNLLSKIEPMFSYPSELHLGELRKPNG